ncbi:MAG TPA: septum formation initiator family protein [Parafilimonas sp.]|nr:septum formation initiator family protein [Parafilimonas sp.]
MHIIKAFQNKYVIALAAFIVLMLFIDHNDIFMQLDRRRQLNDLLASKAYYEKQIEQTKKNLSELQNNPAALEKFAREKYLLKKDNEDVFVVPVTKNQKNTGVKQ